MESQTNKKGMTRIVENYFAYVPKNDKKVFGGSLC
jgi:hypothetical protein